MNINLDNKFLNDSNKLELQRLLDSTNPNITDDLEQIWYLMDKVWDEMECDNKNPNWNRIYEYYSHPIWMLNGLFIENHELSMSIRKSIAAYIKQNNFKKICDYGGGFGTLAKEIATLCPYLQIDIYEPFPSDYAKQCIGEFENIRFISKLQNDYYDCLVTTDVLEHVDDVLGTLKIMMDSIKNDAEMLIGNCFYPVIKCHLPKHFHFRYSFKYIAESMGLKYENKIEGAEYVEIFTKKKEAKITNKTKLLGGGQ